MRVLSLQVETVPRAPGAAAQPFINAFKQGDVAAAREVFRTQPENRSKLPGLRQAKKSVYHSFIISHSVHS